MGRLHEDVKLFMSDQPKDPSRVLLSSGSTRSISQSYCQNAFVPLLPWKPLAISERTKLICENKPVTPQGKWISIISIPDENTLATLRGVGTGKKSVSQETYNQLISSLLFSIDSHIVTYNDMHVHSIKTDPPGLLTVTKSYEDNCFIGLHLDSWDRQSMDKTQYARNRICINLGHEPRYLLFCNLDMMKMLNVMSLSQEVLTELRESNNGLGREIGYLFLQENPNYPIVKLKINPGEAYIAPTENVFHDGSTIEQEHGDMNIMIRGYFSP